MKKSRERFQPRVESLESRICMSFGGLDTAFGDAGTVVFENERTVDSLDKVNGIVALADNSLVVSGTSEVGRGPILSFAKLDAQGALDPSFGGDGLVTLPFELADSTVVATTNGNLYVGGNRFAEGELKYLVLKVNANGALDATFGGIGYRAFAADSRIVAVGDSLAVLAKDDVPWSQYTITKLAGDGSIDESFGTLGVSEAIVVPSDTGVTGPPQFVLDEAGRYLVASEFDASGSQNLHVTRLTSAGAIDSTYGNNGILDDAVEVGSDWKFVVEQGAGGAALVVWLDSDEIGTAVSARRIQADGTADTSFGTDGLLTNPDLPGAFNSSYESSPLLVTTGTRETMVLVSIEDFFREFRFHSLVIGSDGQWDTSHGDSGIGVSSKQEFRYLDAVTPVELSSGDVRVAAWGYDTSQQPIVDWRIFGLSADGTTDAAFGVGGFASADFTQTSSYVDTFDFALTRHSIAVLQSPRVQEAAMPRPSLGVGEATVIRRNGGLNGEHPSGGGYALDAAVTDGTFAWTTARDGGFLSVTVTPDEGQSGFPALLVLEKKLATGAVDTSFGDAGVVTIPTHLVEQGMRPILRQASDGTIYVVVQTDDDSHPAWIAKLSEAGQLLISFGDEGMVQFDATTDSVVDATVSSDRVHLLLGNAAYDTGSSEIIIKALGTTGAVDASFGDQGVYTASVPSGSQLIRVVEDDAGRLLVLYRTGMELRLQRVTALGQADTSFGTDGEVVISDQLQTKKAHADVCLFGNEAIVAVTTGLFSDDSMIAKLEEDGSLDTSFGQGGEATFDLGRYGEEVRSVSVLPDASVVFSVRVADANSAYGVVAKLEGMNPSPVPLHNTLHPLNVSRPEDTVVSARDALFVIFYLNHRNEIPADAGPEDVGYVDVNGDGYVSPLDALQVIFALNHGEGEGEAEGEATATGWTADSDRYWALLGLAEIDDDESSDAESEDDALNPYQWL